MTDGLRASRKAPLSEPSCPTFTSATGEGLQSTKTSTSSTPRARGKSKVIQIIEERERSEIPHCQVYLSHLVGYRECLTGDRIREWRSVDHHHGQWIRQGRHCCQGRSSFTGSWIRCDPVVTTIQISPITQIDYHQMMQSESSYIDCVIHDQTKAIKLYLQFLK